MARTAVIAGTATAVSGTVAAGQEAAARDRAELHARRAADVGAASAAQPPAPQSVDEMLDRLTRLGELRAAGILTEEEFAAQKARIVGA